MDINNLKTAIKKIDLINNTFTLTIFNKDENGNITSQDNDYTIPNEITNEVDKMKFIFEKIDELNKQQNNNSNSSGLL